MSNHVCRLSLSLLFFVKSKQGAGGKKGEGVVARSESYHERTHTLARSARSARTHAPIIIYIRVCAFWEGFGVLGFSTGGFILVSDYVRMEVTLIGASWDVVAGVQTGCGLHSYEALWSTELPCAFS